MSPGSELSGADAATQGAADGSWRANVISEDDPLYIIPVGEQSLLVERGFVTEFERAVYPIVIAERVWIAREGESLVLHVGQRTVVDGPIRLSQEPGSGL
jgi:hypothetical protein